MRFTSFTLHDFFEPQIDPRLQIIFCKKILQTISITKVPIVYKKINFSNRTLLQNLKNGKTKSVNKCGWKFQKKVDR